jgi:L-aminopeptidase/D-esterase-like protein
MTATDRPVDLTPFGLAVGHASDDDGATGLTVVRGLDAPFRAAATVLGRASGSRELGTLDPSHLVERVDAILLTGGSAYGLNAAAGVMRWLEERGRGLRAGPGVVPIVPAAVVFDLAPLGRFDARPTPEMAHAAADAARPAGIAEGSVGAGTGCTVGKALGPDGAMKGGVGVAVAGDPRAGLAVAALAVLNAFGDVHDAAGRVLAGARRPDGAFADARAVIRAGGVAARLGADPRPGDGAGDAPANTTLAVVAVSEPRSRVELRQLAMAATAALHRRIVPTGTSFDGDVIFAVSPLGEPPPSTPTARLAAEVLAVDALERAVERAVRTARGRDGVPGLADPIPEPR